MQGETDDDGKVTEESPRPTRCPGLKVVDDLTLEVTLTGPFAGFSTMLGYTGFFPVAQACLDDIEACAVKPIGNGPFQVDEWNQGVSLTAEQVGGLHARRGPRATTHRVDRVRRLETSTGRTSSPATSTPRRRRRRSRGSRGRPRAQPRATWSAPAPRSRTSASRCTLEGPWNEHRVPQGDLDGDRPRGHHSMRCCPARPACRLVGACPVPSPAARPARASGASSTPRPRWRRSRRPAAGRRARRSCSASARTRRRSRSGRRSATRSRRCSASRTSSNATPDFSANRREPGVRRPVPQQLVPGLPAERELPRPGVRVGRRRERQHQLRLLQRRLRGRDRRRATRRRRSTRRWPTTRRPRRSSPPTSRRSRCTRSVSSTYYSERLSNVVLDPFSGRDQAAAAAWRADEA